MSDMTFETGITEATNLLPGESLDSKESCFLCCLGVIACASIIGIAIYAIVRATSDDPQDSEGTILISNLSKQFFSSLGDQ